MIFNGSFASFPISHQFSILFNGNFTFFSFFGQFSMLFNGKFAFCQFSMLFNGNLRIESSGGDGRTDRRTDGRMEIHPCVLQDIGPLGPLPKKSVKSKLEEVNSHKSVRWSAVPLPCPSRLCLKLKGKQGSGLKGVDDLCFHTYGGFSSPLPSPSPPP